MPVVCSVFCLVLGFILGAVIRFGDGTPYWVGTYTNDTWSGNQRVSLVLKKDGTCKKPKQENTPCTYEVRDGYVYFNGETTSSTAIGQDGLVYSNSYFTKLK